MSTTRVAPVECPEDRFAQAFEAESKEHRRLMATSTFAFLQKCSSETTIHGIRYLFESDSSLTRRVLWLTVIVACAGFCMQQVHGRITRFLSDDQIVDVDIVFTNRQQFPHVILCNNNLFKATRTKDIYSYMLADQFFSSVENVNEDLIKNADYLDQRSVQSTGHPINMTQIYISYGHKIDEMLIRCEFRGQRCSAANFSPVLTYQGACYRFIGNGEPLFVTNAGAGTGLSLLMNVEQYAYMNSRRLSAGVTISIQPEEKVPLIAGRAFVVPVGGEVFISLEANEVHLVPPPKSECSNKVLQYYSEYSVPACQLECRTKYVVDNCGCRIGFMPGNDNETCRISKYFGCAYPHFNNFTQSPDAEACSCPPSCTETIFSPTMTFAPISEFFTKTYSAQLSSDSQLLKEYITALDIFDFHHKLAQRDTEIMTLVKFVPYVIQFENAATLFYPILDQIDQCLASLLQATSSQQNQSFQISQIKLVTETVRRVTVMLRRVDPTFKFHFKLADQDDWSNFLASMVGSVGRTLFFGNLRNDTDEVNTASTFLFLQQNLSFLVAEIVTSSTRVIKAEMTFTLQGTLKADLLQNLTSLLVQLKTSSVTVASALDPLVNDGLRDLEEYILPNVPKASSFNLDPSFVRNNYIRLEIFFKEMRILSIQKQMSDSIISLICDLGGTFGLFLGASMMSVYELIDFSLCYIRMRCS